MHTYWATVRLHQPTIDERYESFALPSDVLLRETNQTEKQKRMLCTEAIFYS